ncbi:sporulation protein YunB [Bacillus massiliglaciei]|uniref:sporulation protein YunB n=1 Tax=Bacillus massiliglaciei TaxID=1816693 RepID=UPI000DA61B57|nr:sporulation protein YunB [Bacillus massiliglaciei]
MFRKRFRPRMKQLKRPFSWKKTFIYTLLFFAVTNLLTIWLVDRSIEPVIKNIAKAETRRIATQSINDSIYENITKKLDVKDLILLQKNGEDGPTTWSFDSKVYNTFLLETTKDIEKRLNISQKESPSSNFNDVMDEEMQSIVYDIPLGVVTGNSLLSNFGPKIPVQLSLVQNVEPRFETKVTSSGINNTFLELFVYFKVNVQIVIPFYKDTYTIENQTKVGDMFFPGEVPEYYSSDKSLPNPVIVEPDKKNK